MHRGENNEQKFMEMIIIAASINKKIVNPSSFGNELWIPCGTNNKLYYFQVTGATLVGTEE